MLIPENSTNNNAQAFLVERNVTVPKRWASGDCQPETKTSRVSFTFGQDDPLLRDFGNLLDLTLRWGAGGQHTSGTWISDACHYPVEEKTERVSKLIQRFVEEHEFGEKEIAISWKV